MNIVKKQYHSVIGPTGCCDCYRALHCGTLCTRKTGPISGPRHNARLRSQFDIAAKLGNYNVT